MRNNPFERMLFDALYGPMQAAWNTLQDEGEFDDAGNGFREPAGKPTEQLPLDC